MMHFLSIDAFLLIDAFLIDDSFLHHTLQHAALQPLIFKYFYCGMDIACVLRWISLRVWRER